MDLQDLQKKYGTDGEITDWTAVSNDDLYDYLNSNREGLQALAEKGILRDQIWAKEVARRSEQDLEWLAGYFLHETNPEVVAQDLEIHQNLIRRENHEPFFDFFVKKDKSRSIAEQSQIKSRLILYPRGSMKSTVGRADIVQWILNFPSIRILILTAAKDLAVGSLDEVKGHFTIRQRTPSLMNLFFPEFCVEEKNLGNQFEFTCPVWAAKEVRRPEPTIMASSIESTLSGFHFELLVGDDMVSNLNSENEDQCMKVGKNYRINKKMLRKWGYAIKIGTRYNDCLVAGTPILMADWSQKPIEDITEGDSLVGWSFKTNRNGKGHKRFLTPSKVLATGKHDSRPVFKYTFESGRSVVATETHKWWGGKGSVNANKDEGYNILSFSYGKLASVRRLLIPKDRNNSWEASWLSGIYDGEGSFGGNPGYPSGVISIAQTKHNPNVLNKIREVLSNLGFEFHENWSEPSKGKYGQEHWKDKCQFTILGGWPERYRFLREVSPIRSTKISESLFGQLFTKEDKLVSIEPCGEQSVYFFQTETGNYIADGCCSKNSDIYGAEISSNVGSLKTTSGLGWELTENPANKSLILVGRAMQVKPEVREALVKKGIPPVDFYKEAGEEGCIFVMPKVLDYSSLMVMYNEDRQGKMEDGSFEGQMNQNPLPEQEAVFDLPLLLRSTVPFTEMPHRGPISHTWDFAFSKKKYRDFTVGTSVIWDEKGVGYTNDLIRDRFITPLAQAKAIVEFARKHHPYVIGIEDAGGSNLLGPTIEAEALKTNDPYVIQVCTKIDWIKPDTQNDAKRIRMAALQPLMEYGLFKFAYHIPFRQIVYDEFIRCQGTRQTKNDIPDALSYQPRYAPRMSMKVIEQGIPSWTGWTKERAAYNLIFEENCDPWGRPGQGGVFTHVFDEPKISEDILSQTYAPGLDNILGGGLIG